MSKTYSSDGPMFPKNAEGTESLEKQKLNFEEFKFKKENENKKKIVDIAKRSIFWILIFMGILVVLDMVFQALEFDNSIVTECISVSRYALTTVLGFLFASNTK